MRIICVAGARPNFMKVKPVLDALEARAVETILVHTGQHYDGVMSEVFFAELGLRSPDRHLEVGSGSHAVQTGRIMAAFEPLIDEVQPDIVVVVGDVNSTMACAIVAAKAGPLVAHVEAGLRSRDWGMPEEINRVVTDRVSDFLFAPSADAVENLLAEGYRHEQIHLVGNVMADTLLSNLDRARARGTIEKLGLARGEYGLATLHRPSNVDDPTVLRGLLDAFGTISAKLPLIFPVHPRTRARLPELGIGGDIRLIEPLGYLDFVGLQDGAAFVLTDSGGVQEETTILGVPCLTLRDNTERPITVLEGTNQVVGTESARIVDAVRALAGPHSEPSVPTLWDGNAGERIAEKLINEGSQMALHRPTWTG